jgi:hypothetical protein
MTRLEAAEMRFLRSVKGYTRLDKIRSKVIRNELEISEIQDVRSKHKQNWFNHLERMENTRLPKHALNYKPRGRRDRGRPRKRWQRVDAGTGQSTKSMEEEEDDDDEIGFHSQLIDKGTQQQDRPLCKTSGDSVRSVSEYFLRSNTNTN